MARINTSQNTFESYYAAYNATQTLLVSLQQKYRGLAVPIFEIQKVMILTDIVGLWMSSQYLYERVNEKFNPKNSPEFKVAFIASFIATIALSCFVAMKINHYMKPAVALKDILVKLSTSPDTLKNVQIAWNAPFSQKVIQCLYVNRIISSIALTCFSNQPKQSLISVAAQSLSFCGISQLQWIELTKCMKDWKFTMQPNGLNMIVKPQELIMKEWKFTTRWMIDLSGNLQTTVQTIYDHVNSIFDNSAWSHLSYEINRNGDLIKRSPYYEVILQKNPFNSIKDGFFSRLTHFSIHSGDIIKSFVSDGKGGKFNYEPITPLEGLFAAVVHIFIAALEHDRRRWYPRYNDRF